MTFDNQLIRTNLIKALARSPLLKLLGQNNPHCQEFRQMLEAAEVVSFHRGQIIIREGKKSDRMYFLAEGRVKVTREGKTLAVLSGVGDVFGEIGPLTGELRTATVTAQDEVVCLATSVDFARQMSKEDNILFAHVLDQALNKMLLSRLNHACEELREAKEALAAAESRIRVLEHANQELESQIRRY